MWEAAFRTDKICRTPPTPQDEMCARMSYFPEAIWKGVQKFLWRIDTSLKNIGINERTMLHLFSSLPQWVVVVMVTSCFHMPLYTRRLSKKYNTLLNS